MFYIENKITVATEIRDYRDSETQKNSSLTFTANNFLDFSRPTNYVSNSIQHNITCIVVIGNLVQILQLIVC